jgi:hypothetical protein
MDSQYNHSYDQGFLSNGDKVAKLTKIKMAADDNEKTAFWQTVLLGLKQISSPNKA